MGSNPSHFRAREDADQRPVEMVSWVDAALYSNKLSALEGLEACYQISENEVLWPKKQDCTGYRLPTEAEWEYAAKAGQNTWYAGSNNHTEVAWTEQAFYAQTHPVAQKKPNAWGLYDLSGNVWEWVWDLYEAGYYNARSINPT